MQTVLLYILIVFSFNLIQTIGAFAGTMLAMPFAILLFGAEQAKLILNAVGLLACIYPIVSCRSSIAWKEVVKILAVMAVGVLAAQFMLDYLYSPYILLFYGLLIISVAIRNFIQTKPLKTTKAVDYILLLAAGVIHGSFLSGGSFLVIYSMEHLKDKDTQRSSLSVIWLATNAAMLFMFIGQGLYNAWNLKYVIIGIVPALLGIFIGDRLQKKLDAGKFRKFTNYMLILSGGVLVYNCLTKIL